MGVGLLNEYYYTLLYFGGAHAHTIAHIFDHTIQQNKCTI